jgi:hypothetical protein
LRLHFVLSFETKWRGVAIFTAGSRWGKAAFRENNNKELVMPVDCFLEIECAPLLDTPGTHVQGHILCDQYKV